MLKVSTKPTGGVNSPVSNAPQSMSFLSKIKASTTSLTDFYKSGNAVSMWVLVALSGGLCIAAYVGFFKLSKRWS